MDSQGWFSGVVGAVIGAVLTLIGAHFLDKWSARADRTKERLSIAEDELHTAFADELALTRSATLKPGVIYEVLKKGFDKHDLAVAKFREFLSGPERAAFDNAWQVYYQSGSELVVPRERARGEYLLRQYHASNDKDEANAQAAAASNIKSILSFVRQK